MNLNKNQKIAAETLSGNILIIASAGTGKTTTIIERYKNLINSGLSPSQIMLTTFTNKAAKEVQFKISKKLGISSVYIGTMHSIFLKILRDNKEAAFQGQTYTLLTDNQEKKKIIKQILKDFSLQDTSDAINYFSNWISKFKSRAILHESLSWEGGVSEARESGKITELLDDEIISIDPIWRSSVNKVYKKYQDFLDKNNLMDFDEILLKTYKMFAENKQILNKYKSQFKSIMVDEAQDLNLIQVNILNQIKNNNLCLIGDDCQNIYEWRGTSNELIFDFQDNEKTIFLEENYRSDENIILAVNKVIESMNKGIEKKLAPTRPAKNNIKFIQFFSSFQELEFIADQVQNLILSGHRPENIAILFRTNNIAKQYQREFIKRKIPCHLSKSVDFFLREEVKDIISFLNFSQNPNSIIDFSKITSIIRALLIALGRTPANKVMVGASALGIMCFFAI